MTLWFLVGACSSQPAFLDEKRISAFGWSVSPSGRTVALANWDLVLINSSGLESVTTFEHDIASVTWLTADLLAVSISRIDEVFPPTDIVLIDSLGSVVEAISVQPDVTMELGMATLDPETLIVSTSPPGPGGGHRLAELSLSDGSVSIIPDTEGLVHPAVINGAIFAIDEGPSGPV